MIYTTLNKIRANGPCSDGWSKLLRHLNKNQADDEPLALATILDSNGLEDALWCLRAVDGHQREIRLYAVWCARQVQHLMTDPRSVAALDVAERHANGQATDKELDAAKDAAKDVAWATGKDAAWAAVGAAAKDTARAAPWNASWNAVLNVARDAIGVTAKDSAWDAARDAQTAEFRRVFCVAEGEKT